MAKMYEIKCDSTCGFRVRSHNRNEVTKFATGHVKNSHHKKLSKTEAEKMMKAS